MLSSSGRGCTKGPRVWSESMPTNGTISVLAPAADDMRIPITLHQQIILKEIINHKFCKINK